MGSEKAGNWGGGEHLGEKKEVLGKVDRSLEGSNETGELAKLITDIAKFRYPQDADASKCREKKSSFDSALDQVAGVCRTDSQLAKYGIEKRDILEWCKVPMLEGSPAISWQKMAERGTFTTSVSAQTAPNIVAENLLALGVAGSKLGLEPDLLENSSMMVNKRNPESFSDRFTGLPKPEKGKETFVVSLEVRFRGSKLTLSYDSSNPSAVFVDGVVALKDANPFVVHGLATLDSGFRVTKMEDSGQHLLTAGTSLPNIVRLLKVAGLGERGPGMS